jgi:hypothetical protein
MQFRVSNLTFHSGIMSMRLCGLLVMYKKPSRSDQCAKYEFASNNTQSKFATNACFDENLRGAFTGQ